MLGAGSTSSPAASRAPHLLFSQLSAVTLNVYSVITDINFKKIKVRVMNVLLLLIEFVLLVLEALQALGNLGIGRYLFI